MCQEADEVGPSFRPDDILGLFERHIDRDGKGTQGLVRPGPGYAERMLQFQSFVPW